VPPWRHSVYLLEIAPVALGARRSTENVFTSRKAGEQDPQRGPLARRADIAIGGDPYLAGYATARVLSAIQLEAVAGFRDDLDSRTVLEASTAAPHCCSFLNPANRKSRGSPLKLQGSAIWIFSIAAALGLLGELAHADADATEATETALDLNGAWQLERTENFEQYLLDSGASWWKRKLAKLGSSRLRQTIEHDGLHFAVTSKSPVETRTEEFVADGVSKNDTVTAAGDNMTFTAHVEGATLVIDSDGDLGPRTIRREIVDGRMVMTLINPAANSRCKLYFERAQAD
jgi:hypothetical protein